jgi:hypothetical protein
VYIARCGAACVVDAATTGTGFGVGAGWVEVVVVGEEDGVRVADDVAGDWLGVASAEGTFWWASA